MGESSRESAWAREASAKNLIDGRRFPADLQRSRRRIAPKGWRVGKVSEEAIVIHSQEKARGTERKKAAGKKRFEILHPAKLTSLSCG